MQVQVLFPAPQSVSKETDFCYRYAETACFRMKTGRFSTNYADNEQVFAWIAQMKGSHPQFQVVSSTAHKEKNITDVNLNRPTLLMIGNETEGLCRAFKESCDVLATIPMSGSSSASSLNVACAATVLFYEAARQRG